MRNFLRRVEDEKKRRRVVICCSEIHLSHSFSLSLLLWSAAVWKSGAALVFSSARNITRAGEEEKLKFSPYAPHHLKTGARVF
jgi:hypothetical protein